MTARARTERGAALLIAIVSIAVLTALAVNLAYESRVALRIAANARDELRASYLARSGVTLSRLVLSFQQELDGLGQQPAGGAAGLGIPRLQLWRLLPVDSDLARSLFPASGPPPRAGDAPAPSRFDATIDDEGRKVNAQFDWSYKGTSGPRAAAHILALYQVVCDPRWDPLFEREDAHGVRTSREDLLQRLRDYVDDDDRGTGLRGAFGAAHCSFVPDSLPIEEGYGDENQPYDRGEDRYKVKNARMDSLDELFLVAGVGDAFMAAFGDALTVYLPRDAKQNVNEVDAERLVRLAMVVADPPLQPRLFEPEFGQDLQKLVLERTLNGWLAITPQQLGDLIRAAGVTVNANLLSPNNPNSPFTDRSSTFRVLATGKAGDVASTIDAVVRSESVKPGVPVTTPGKLVHWQEE